MNKSKKSFIPRDKPKTWVICVSSSLIALLVTAPTILAGVYLGSDFLKGVGVAGFLLCWATLAVSGVVFACRMLTGKYRNIEPREWKDQIW